MIGKMKMPLFQAFVRTFSRLSGGERRGVFIIQESTKKLSGLSGNNGNPLFTTSSYFSALYSSSSSSSSSSKSSSQVLDGGGSEPIIGLKSRREVDQFLNKLSEDQKQLLFQSLNVELLRERYQEEMGNPALTSGEFHYLSKWGRPATTRVPYSSSEDHDPMGPTANLPGDVSAKWLQSKTDQKGAEDEKSSGETETVLPNVVNVNTLLQVGIKNALPFIGFGFLDNLIMILAGDYIDAQLGVTLGISTMAAAALGNAISDVMGIGSAWYVESTAERIGIKYPSLTPAQMALWSVRWATNGGRGIGVFVGCLLGMFPLLFLPSKKEKESSENEPTKTTNPNNPSPPIIPTTTTITSPKSNTN